MKGKIVVFILFLFLITIPISIIYNLNADNILNQKIHTNLSYTSIGALNYGLYFKKSNNDYSQSKQQNLTPYSGSIKHVLLSPLEADTLLGSSKNGHSDVPQFFYDTLEKLYEDNYILISIDSIYEYKTANDDKHIMQKPLFLPQNKKPLLITIADFDYIQLITLIDEFVEKNNDFSFEGAKGIIALTGSEKIFDYGSKLTGSDYYYSKKQKASEFIDKLKNTGWLFACHGYYHNDLNKISYKKVVEDTKKWKSKVESITGSTNIYLYPFGNSLPRKGPKYRHLLQSNYTIQLSLEKNSIIEFTDKSISMSLCHIQDFNDISISQSLD